MSIERRALSKGRFWFGRMGRLFLWGGAWVLLSFFLLLAWVAALAALRPTHAVVYILDRTVPNYAFSADEVRWTSWNSVRIENARLRRFLMVPRVDIRWKWFDLLWNHRIGEIKLEGAQIQLNLHDLGELRPQPGQILHHQKTPQGQWTPWGGASPRLSWRLDKLIVERGGLVMVGLGPGLLPIALEVEGEYDDIPLGTAFSEKDLQKPRKVEFRNIHIHSPEDPSATLLEIQNARIEFRRAGLLAHELDSLVFQKPVLHINQNFFWFVDDLRSLKARIHLNPHPGHAWITHRFQIQEGELDISRLKGMAIQFPFPFEVTRRDLALKKLSLEDFPIEMSIPNQNITWGAAQMTFKNIRGKIAFNLGEPSRGKEEELSVKKHANNLVNTIYVDSIHWKNLEVTQGWLAMTFTRGGIESRFGGNFAEGDAEGGVSCGWSGKEPWETWGSAPNANVGRISDDLGYESFAMNGRAEMTFEVSGQERNLDGVLNLKSLSSGTIQIKSLDRVIENIQKKTKGMKKELMTAFTQALRDFPYKEYTLDIRYHRPNANLIFRSEGDRGSRNINLVWHGEENEELRIEN